MLRCIRIGLVVKFSEIDSRREVGLKLKEARLKRFMTIRDLATAADVSTRTIVLAESGRSVPYFSTAKKIADALGVNAMDIEEFVARVEGEVSGKTAA